MPNDMPQPSVFSETAGLANRTERYCARARTLVDDPGLTTAVAARALGHLETLQNDITAVRLRATAPITAKLQMVEEDLKPFEAQLKQARMDLSSALMRAKPDGGVAYGLLPHGARSDDVIHGGHPETPAPCPPGADVHPISACRTLLDLEALRPYLSDQALRQAIEKHSRETGRFDVPGVAYATLPASAHLPCDVL